MKANKRTLARSARRIPKPKINTHQTDEQFLAEIYASMSALQSQSVAQPITTAIKSPPPHAA